MERIKKQLSQIERDHQVRILYACESGSRAWCFPSADSDYDVRFIYIHRPEWYLAMDLEHRRDVIELPIDDLLDINGWDIRKALKLFAKSNPPLLEWLDSPIVYAESGAFAQRLRGLIDTSFSPRNCAYHYIHMARRNFRAYLRGDRVRTKKYFYVLRPLLATLWLERDLGPVPMEFSKLVQAVVDDSALRRRIEQLVEEKRHGFESDEGPRIDIISDFIDSEFARLENGNFAIRQQKPDIEPLNRLFQDTLSGAFHGVSAG